MHIEHIAVWTRDLERLRAFYETYFGAAAGPKYVNAAKGFESYFLTFAGGARLEVMMRLDVGERPGHDEMEYTGYAHLAVAAGSAAAVDALTARLAGDGYLVVSAPRWTGDGYYESCMLDPDGNRVEITV